MLGICQDHTPQVEVAALDDLYLDLGPHGAQSAEDLALDLRGEICDEVGLTVSIGIGVNKLIAGVATQEAKDRRILGDKNKEPLSGVVCVAAGEECEYLAPWPAEVLPGVGPKLLARLHRLNVRHVFEVAEMPVPVLCGVFGARGRVLHDLAHGIDPRPVQPYRPQQTVSRCTSFDPPTADRAFLMGMLDHLLDRAVSWLRFSSMVTRGLTISLRYGDYEGAQGRATFRRSTDQETLLKETARDRLRRLYDRRLPLRFLGVELSPLRTPDRQPDLFPEAAEVRDRRLAACKDAVRGQFGFMSLVTGSALVLSEEVEHDRENFRLRTPCLTR
jgi:DNA polymerase-4